MQNRTPERNNCARMAMSRLRRGIRHLTMPTICPKCNTVRPSETTAPEWQCPACGVAYAKGWLDGGASLTEQQGRDGGLTC
jgi:ribosomal protein L37AE/L43A